MNGKKSVEDYLMDMINARYAKRVMSQLNTEHERDFMDLGKDPDHKEYEWMVKRALEIHRAMNVKDGEDAEKAKD